MPDTRRHRLFRYGLLISLLPGVLLFGGCETSALSSGSANYSARAPRSVADPLQSELHTRALTLQKNATSAEALALLGEPDRTDEITNESGIWARWVFERDIAPIYREMVTEMVEVPFVDPVNGQESIILEPRAGHQRIDRQETITLTFHNNLLVNLTRSVEAKPAFAP